MPSSGRHKSDNFRLSPAKQRKTIKKPPVNHYGGGSAAIRANELAEEEIRLYMDDSWLFCRRLVKTEDRGGFQPYPDWNYLRRFDDALNLHDKVIVLKSRQMFMSWAMCAYAVWYALFHRSAIIMFISKREKESKELIRRCSRIIRNLPDPFRSWATPSRPKVDEIETITGSRIMSFPATELAGQGYTADVLFFDEFAHMPNAEAIYGALMPVIDNKGKVICSSTPGADPECFHLRLWKNRDERGFHGLQVHYSSRPDRDEEWQRQVAKGMSREQWEREYECTLDGPTGRIYIEFNPEVNVIDPFRIEGNCWTLYRAIDWGWEHFACLWIACLDDADKGRKWFVYREYTPQQALLEQHAAQIKEFSGTEIYAATICDPAGAQERAQLANMGIPTMINDKEPIIEGINRVKRFLAPMGDDTRLFVFRHCQNLIKEFRKWRWKKRGVKPEDRNDHCLDCLRYTLQWADKYKPEGNHSGGPVTVSVGSFSTPSIVRHDRNQDPSVEDPGSIEGGFYRDYDYFDNDTFSETW